MEFKKIVVTCPVCGRGIAHYDGRGTIPIQRKCEKCNKLIIFNPKDGTKEIKEMPHRQYSSGKRFY